MELVLLLLLLLLLLSLETGEQVTRIHEGFLLEDRPYDNSNIRSDDSYADGQYRLQLRLLTLLLHKMCGAPTLQELLSMRHIDVKVCKVDENGALPPLGEFGSNTSGEGVYDILTLRYGPDENGKYVVFPALQHKKANECCYNALADLFLYEEKLEPGPRTTVDNWFTDLNDESPFIFHKPGQRRVPIGMQGVSRDLIAALVRVGGPPSVGVIARSGIEDSVNRGSDRHEQEARTLAPTVPPFLSKYQVRLKRAMDFTNSLQPLMLSSVNSAGFKLQSYGERWPLARLDCMKSRMAEKHYNRVIRHVNEVTTGCNRCGKKHQNDGKSLMKCSQCRVVLYCSAACQKNDWKTHKVHCYRILPSKRKDQDCCSE
jgi:hypothetical protein